MAEVGEAVRAARVAASMSQETLAARMSEMGHGFHVTTVGKIERGERRVTLEEAAVLAGLLRTTVGSLAGLGDDADYVRGYNQALKEMRQVASNMLINAS